MKDVSVPDLTGKLAVVTGARTASAWAWPGAWPGRAPNCAAGPVPANCPVARPS